MKDSLSLSAFERLRRDRDTRAAALDRYDDISDVPLILLSILIVPLIVLPLTMDLDPAVSRAFFAVDWTIWAVFGLDLTVRTYLSERRLRYLLHHWYDVLIVAVPFMRPLRLLRSARALRLLRLSRAGAFTIRAFDTAREIGQHYGVAYVAGVAGIILIACASLVFAFERDQGGQIDSFGTAIWWAFATVTTVGYGDAVPVTSEGRGVAIFLMLMGITLFGFITASIASFMVERGQAAGPSTADLMSKLESLEHEVRQLRQDVADRGTD